MWIGASELAGSFTGHSKKPLKWDFNPELTAYPEVWAGRVQCVPLWDVPGETDQDTAIQVLGRPHGADSGLQGDHVVDAGYDGAAPRVLSSGLGIEVDATTETTPYVANVLDGADEMTLLFVGSTDSNAADLTMFGQWKAGVEQLVAHLDTSGRIRFLLNDGTSTLGGYSATSVYAAGDRMVVACRLTPAGTMQIFYMTDTTPRLSVVSVRTGTPFTINSADVKIGFLGDSTNVTNDAWDGTAEIGFICNKALDDGFIYRWMLDPFCILRPDPLKMFAAIAVAPAGRIMSSLANAGGLAGYGGIAGQGGGLAG